MVDFNITINGEQLAGVQAKLDDGLPQLLDDIGTELVASAKKAFRLQGKPGGTWGARMTPNVPAIVESLNKGKGVAKHYLAPKKALYDTGHLFRSIDFKIAPSGEIEVGTSVEYAQLMHEGGESKHELVGQGRRNLYLFLKKKANKPYRSQLGWLFQQPAFTVNVQARPFLKITDADIAEIGTIIIEHLEA